MAAAPGQDHFPLLALPDGLVDRIAYLLPPGDRGNLAATCTALRTSGRCWFRGVVVRVRSGDRCRLAELKQWVEERQALIAYSLASQALLVQEDLAALPAGHVMAIRGYAVEQWAAPAVLAPLTTLTELRLFRQAQLSGSQLEQILQRLAQLRHLTICGFDHLRPLVQLRQLHLQANDLDEVPAAISALTALQHLSLGYPAGGWQHLRPLAQLRSFDALRCWDNAPGTRLLLASEAAANLHPAAVQRVLDESGGDLPELLDLLAQRSLPHPI
ncbi:hypothetical protein COHA_004609 [Chlorella ohadii]|uniref:Uncharacterized protein n=1 Tax=Chlorella ohadii TaxID=2649997 RepID=A0AAD5H5L0_9CHLO|nr:hypothetical protein COHA_004609 [Chlorella ohadii]